MSLTKKKLTSLLRLDLESHSYSYLKDRTMVMETDSLFYKKLDEDLILFLGFHINKEHPTWFTATFHLFPIFDFGSFYPGYPERCYMDITQLLTEEEKKLHLMNDPNQDTEGMDNWWWNSEDLESQNHFIKVLLKVETLFLNQPNLIEDAVSSLHVFSKTMKLYKRIKHLAENNDFSNEMKFDSIHGVPNEWYNASEFALQEKYDADVDKSQTSLTAYAIVATAVEAWRYFNLK